MTPLFSRKKRNVPHKSKNPPHPIHKHSLLPNSNKRDVHSEPQTNKYLRPNRKNILSPIQTIEMPTTLAWEQALESNGEFFSHPLGAGKISFCSCICESPFVPITSIVSNYNLRRVDSTPRLKCNL